MPSIGRNFSSKSSPKKEMVSYIIWTRCIRSKVALKNLCCMYLFYYKICETDSVIERKERESEVLGHAYSPLPIDVACSPECKTIIGSLVSSYAGFEKSLNHHVNIY